MSSELIVKYKPKFSKTVTDHANLSKAMLDVHTLKMINFRSGFGEGTLSVIPIFGYFHYNFRVLSRYLRRGS